METPQSPKEEHIDLLKVIVNFVSRNAFGILCFIAGFIYQLYKVSGMERTLTFMQTVYSVTMWLFGGMAVIYGLGGIEMNKFFYGLACWATPIIIKPIADAVAENAKPVSEKVIKALMNMWTKNIED